MRYFLLSALVLGTVAKGYDAKQVLLVDVKIGSAVFESDSDDRKRWEGEVRNQLHYLVSQLRPYRATPALFHTLKLEIKKVAKGTHAKNSVEYSATLQASWRRNENFPASVSVLMPLRADAPGMQEFENNYLAGCGASPLWYYFQPYSPGCLLSKQTPEDAQRVTVSVDVSPENTKGKFPEYEKIWEDGKLVITHVMGNMNSRFDGEADDDQLHREISQAYSNVKHTVTDGFNYTTQISQFSSAAGPIELRTMRILDGNVQNAGSQFKEEFEALQQDSDVIGYNGHAGLGQNVRAFLRMVKPAPKHYSLVWINACVPFAYFDDSAINAAKVANPQGAWSKYLDLFIVTEVGTFAGASDVMDLVRTLPTKSLPFTELVPSMVSYGPMVIGEEDNAWPNPF